MKATGIIRRIDDLGRISIPKEIRRTLQIHENDPLELFVAEDSVVIKKYSPEKTVRSALKTLHETVVEEPQFKNRENFIKKISELFNLLDAPEESAE